jgi:steroid 5-alpha reductase family enzyme
LHVYLVIRNSGEPEDRRYQAIRKNNSPGFWWKSYFIVFLLQAVLAWIASLVIAGAMAKSQAPGWLVMVGLVIATAGFFVEAVADWQLARFKANLANAGKVMDLGLWRYSRHPNYFGECCFWWGIALVALVAGYWWTLISPLLMTVLLLRVSGVTLLEKDISERRPAYRDYIRRTSAFIPRRPLPVSER